MELKLKLLLFAALAAVSVVSARPALGGGLTSVVDHAKEDMTSALFGFNYLQQDRTKSEVSCILSDKSRGCVGFVEFGIGISCERSQWPL